MNHFTLSWNRLIKAARLARHEERAEVAPYGFSTRIAALAFAAEVPLSTLLSRFSWRALGVSTALMACVVASNLTPVLGALDDATAAVTDPVSEWIELS